MTDYLPVALPGQRITLQASGTITGGQLVEVSGSGTVAATSGASAKVVGIAAFDAVSGDKVLVYAAGIVQHATASGTVTAGQNVDSAASGAVATHTNGTTDYNIVGLALTTATTGNDVRYLSR